MSYKRIGNFERYKENPFLEKAISAVEGGIVKKYKSATSYDQRAVLQAVDPKTGELLGHTSFIRQVEVDEDKFAKIYLSNFSAFFDLRPSAIKVFGYILNQIKPGEDMFLFFIEDCIKYTGYKSHNPVYNGLNCLISSEIIARGRADNIYFINPLVVFNGNRVTFAKSYVKKKKKTNKNQMKLFEEKRLLTHQNQTQDIQSKLEESDTH
jgi:hypothetical protein